MTRHRFQPKLDRGEYARALEAGATARRKGKALLDCPYKPRGGNDTRDRLRRAWIDGWYQQDALLRKGEVADA